MAGEESLSFRTRTNANPTCCGCWPFKLLGRTIGGELMWIQTWQCHGISLPSLLYAYTAFSWCQNFQSLIGFFCDGVLYTVTQDRMSSKFARVSGVSLQCSFSQVIGLWKSWWCRASRQISDLQSSLYENRVEHGMSRNEPSTENPSKDQN